MRLKWAFISVGVVMLVASIPAQTTQPDLHAILEAHQFDLATDGMTFLADQGRQASFVLVGGLHGDNETLALVQTLFARLAPSGFKYLATELSPWAAARMAGDTGRNGVALWGCDIEADQPQGLIRDLAAANPQNPALQEMVTAVKSGYIRRMAPDLLARAKAINGITDAVVGGMSLRTLLVRTLEVEAMRVNSDAALEASASRELAMKDFFLLQYRGASAGGANPKVLLSFGQNHLHRGYDSRGVSTLGNFVAELAVEGHVQSFHIALFAAGGQVALGGLQNADQRSDEPAFGVLASLAKYPATVFDMRPVREASTGGHATACHRLTRT